ncbi:hypothetical protein UFOVP1382_84 [uncultured Caudovirales phage]|uniref:Uncharacterized protein n=1 Tax=uncultured Caudovirales phage TaxID=2100421 RepID=A0A6J5S3C7_9CAUD|nr:hypothetical protein UFOVP1382_84 [uncultured Caudovirales phage]
MTCRFTVQITRFDAGEKWIEVVADYGTGSPGTRLDPPDGPDINIVSAKAADEDVDLTDDEYDEVCDLVGTEYDNWLTDQMGPGPEEA